MKTSIATIIVLATFWVSRVEAASKYFYDLQKFQTILANKEIEAKLGMASLDGIVLKSSNETKRTLNYELLSGNGKCKTMVVVGWSEGMSPHYRVLSIGNQLCP